MYQVNPSGAFPHLGHVMQAVERGWIVHRPPVRFGKLLCLVQTLD